MDIGQPPSGEQHEISFGKERAVITEIGATLRAYSAGDRPIIEPFAPDAMSDGAHGQLLIPWPNRIRDGTYRWRGVSHQLPLNEAEAHHAIHGLVRWEAFRLRERTANALTLTHTIHPSPGYPFTIDIQVVYDLSDQGLRVTTSAVNRGPDAAPFAFGQHPYLSPGPGAVDDAVLTLPARRRLVTDDRLIPVREEPVAGTAFDFTQGRKIGDAVLDTAFTDLARDADGRARAFLTGADGRHLELWVDPAIGYIQVFTGDTLGVGRRRTALAMEPMTAPANAFQSGSGIIPLERGNKVEIAWGVRMRA